MPLKVSYDNSSGRLIIESESEQPSHEPESILEWLSERGLPTDPPVFYSPLREKLSLEQRLVEGEIQDLCKTLQRKALELRVHNYILAPVRLIPQEVLRRILTFLAPGSFALQPLMEVCRLWRSTIHDMPCMWEDIMVTGDNRKEGWLALQLMRATVTRLDIHWQPSCYEPNDLMEAVLSRSQLWRTLFFDETGTKQVSHPKVLDALRKAEVLREITWFGDDSFPNEAVITLPSVRVLKFLCASSLPTLILTNLTTLCLETVVISRNQFQTFPDQFPSLQSMQDSASHFPREHAVEVLTGLIASPPKFRALEALEVLDTNTEAPLWLAIAAGAPNLKTVLLRTEVIRSYHKLRKYEVCWIPRVRSLIIVVGWGNYWEYDKLLHLFTGVENLELRSEQSNVANASIRYLLGGTSCTTIGHYALFPRLARLSLKFTHYSTEEDLSILVREMLQSLTEARFMWYCPVFLQMEDGIIFLDATAEEFCNLLENFENSWPSIRDSIHRNIPLHLHP